MRLERLAASAPAPVWTTSGPTLERPLGGTHAYLMSAVGHDRPTDRVAGFLCAFSFALSGIAVVRNPGLLATAAILVAFTAVVMTRSHRTLAAAAVAVGAAAFLVGMVVAVLTDSALY